MTKKKKKKKKKSRRVSTLSSLPQDLIIEVVRQLVASKSPAPLKDIARLRATCKTFYAATEEKLVRSCIDVSKDDMRMGKDAYLSLLRWCATGGNVDANFILGVEEIYNHMDAVSGLHHLQRATHGGHAVAAYFMGVVLFRHPATRPDAMAILNKVSSGDHRLAGLARGVDECRRSGNPTVDR